jgi:hypothetical protein
MEPARQKQIIVVNGTPLEIFSFRDGFIAGWSECLTEREPDQTKRRQIAEAAADAQGMEYPPRPLLVSTQREVIR